ncbi:hypothetical protein NLI96_g8544 [Meripilus lineatus]|uniref:GH16 domain-containing protein n=1 Tax=Meripilus lineatus TaxID=2056292 RepID=A0AAD5UYP5_9APHY|nr:hypothetical protein NLI96_g8544 [Physisporinus lineatus]
MYLKIPLFLLLTIPPFADAHFPSITRATSEIHRRAIKRSSGLARDLRIAFGGLRVDKRASGPGNVYCVSNPSVNETTPDDGSSNNNGNTSPLSSGQPRSSSSTSGRGSPSATGSSGSPATPTSGASSRWKLKQSMQGNTFFDGWTFFTGSDPTHGQVTYVDQNTAVPTGRRGEIDIVEGVHDYTNNQATVHTNQGCTIPSSSSNALAISGTLVGGTNCAVTQTGNQGCGIRASQSNSFGAAFNNINGGVYAMEWDDDGVAIFFFPRGQVPSDIDAEAPQPSQWGKPMAYWPASTCSPYQFFYDHNTIFDTTLCGDWAGAVWTGTGIPGQEQSCAQRTGVATCEEFVRNNGGSLNEAYWEVKSVKIYQTS